MINGLTRASGIDSLISIEGIGEEIRQALGDNRAGQQRLSEALKDNVDRMALSTPARSIGKITKLKTEIDSLACEPVIPPEIAPDHPTKPTETSSKGQASISASGNPMPNDGQRPWRSGCHPGNWQAGPTMSSHAQVHWHPWRAWLTTIMSSGSTPLGHSCATPPPRL